MHQRSERELVIARSSRDDSAESFEATPHPPVLPVRAIEVNLALDRFSRRGVGELVGPRVERVVLAKRVSSQSLHEVVYGLLPDRVEIDHHAELPDEAAYLAMFAEER